MPAVRVEYQRVAAMKLLFVTGSRADWNGLGMVAKEAVAAGHDVIVAATGQHIWGTEPTNWIIEEDGLGRPYMLGDESDEPPDNIPGMHGLIAKDLSEFLSQAPIGNSDMVVLAGDRWEVHAAATAAALMTFPIAHIAGGDVTRGSLDDKLRDSITMLSQVHFPTNEPAATRIDDMTGGGARIYQYGSPALDRIRATPIWTRQDTFAGLGIGDAKRTILIAYHPDTLEIDPAAGCHEMLGALACFLADTTFLIIAPNADAGSDKVGRLLRTFAAMAPNARMISNLPAQVYYSALAHFDLMIGNSSAGLYEAPSFGIPVVNIGDRQDGRIEATNVISVRANEMEIRAAVAGMLAGGRTANCKNPYGDGHSAPRIVDAIGALGDPRALLRRAS